MFGWIYIWALQSNRDQVIRHPDSRISSFALVGFHSVLAASFKRVVYFVMDLISVSQDPLCGAMFENGAFSNKK